MEGLKTNLLTFLALLLLPSGLTAQQTSDRVSVGLHYSTLALSYPNQTRSGLGGWFAHEVFDHVGVDAAFSIFPADDTRTRRLVQLLAGGRAGLGGDRLEAFGRIRPGLTRFSQRFFAPDIACILIFPPPDACLIRSVNFTIDIGGTVQLFPTRRAVIRVDAGDSLIRFGRGQLVPVWKHNLQLVTGVGVRF